MNLTVPIPHRSGAILSSILLKTIDGVIKNFRPVGPISSDDSNGAPFRRRNQFKFILSSLEYQFEVSPYTEILFFEGDLIGT